MSNGIKMTLNNQIPQVIIEYVSKLTEDETKFLQSRLEQNFSGDVADALEFIQKNETMDLWLKTAADTDEFYWMLDMVMIQLNKSLGLPV